MFPPSLTPPLPLSGVSFLVHQANLSVSSTDFTDMFESATSGKQKRPTIDMEESAEILERLLPYCYPSVTLRWEYVEGEDVEFVQAVDKYHVRLPSC